jgi:hypothetical protein
MINVFHNIPASMRPFVRSGLPVTATKTYELRAPVRSHFRKATCKEIDCGAYLHGWATTVAPGGEDEALIRRAGRAFTVERTAEGWLRFMFSAGQPCFAASSHVVTLEREPLYLVRGGDWRANTGVIRRHVNGDDWVDDFATNQDRLATQIERG